MVSCSAVHCTNNSNQGFKFYRFPKDPDNLTKWLRNCGRRNWLPTPGSCLCEVHFEDVQFETHRADGYRKLKHNAVPTLFVLRSESTSFRRTQKTEYDGNDSFSYEDNVNIFESDDDQADMVEQRMTFVHPRVEEIRDSFRGRQTSTRGRKRGRPRKRPNDDLDEWTPERPRAVRGRKRGRPPSTAGRGRQVASLSPVRKAPRGRGRVANDRRRPGPKPKLEGPGPAPAVITPGGKCFVCSKAAGTTGSPLGAFTPTTKVHLHQKLGRVVGAELDLIVDEDGVLCQSCTRLLNYMDRIEVEHSMITKSILNCMRRTFGFGYVQGDCRMPDAVLASIEDHSKNSIIPVEKLGLNLDAPAKDDSDGAAATLRNKMVMLTDGIDKKSQPLIDTVPEMKTESECDKKLYQCQICTFKNKHKSVFLVHLRQHLRNNYRCDFCNAMLPKGFKVLENRNVEVGNGESLVNKSLSTIDTEAIEVPVTKEVKDYVETMIEELHTTGIVTTMKPLTPEKLKSSLQVRSDIKPSRNTGDTIMPIEIRDAHTDYMVQGQTDIDRGTLNIVLTFPDEKRQKSISVCHDIPVVEHNFSNDAVARELSDIFGNFNEEPFDTEDRGNVLEKESVENSDTRIANILPHTPLLSNSPGYRDRNEASLEELNSDNEDNELEVQQDNEDTEDKYQKQLALLDEMGLIMLPKKSKLSVHKQNSEIAEVKGDSDCERDRDPDLDDLHHIGNDVQRCSEYKNQITGDRESKVVKEETDRLPESLDHKAVTSPVAVANISIQADTVRPQSGDGTDRLKSDATLLDKDPHWLQQVDSNATTESDRETVTWAETAMPPDQSETSTATDAERNWSLPEQQMSKSPCADIKETEADVHSNRNEPGWDPAHNGSTDSGDEIFRRTDIGHDNVNGDSAVCINGEGGTGSTHTIVSDNSESCFGAKKMQITEISVDNEGSSCADRTDLGGNILGHSSDPDVQSSGQKELYMSDGERRHVSATEEKTDALTDSHSNEWSPQGEPTAVFGADVSDCKTILSGLAGSNSEQVYVEEVNSSEVQKSGIEIGSTEESNSSEVKQFDFQGSGPEMCSMTENISDSGIGQSSFGVSGCEHQSLKEEEEVTDMGVNTILVQQSKFDMFAGGSDFSKLDAEHCDTDVDESTAETDFKNVER